MKKGPIQLQRSGKIISLILLAAVLFSLCTYKIRDPDIWLYLKTGSWAIKNFDFPLKDVYSYTHPGADWVNHSWLSQVIFYLLYRFLQTGGLYLARYLILGATFSLLFLTIRGKIGEGGAVGLTLLSIFSASQRFVVRPELFTFFFLSLLIFILERERSAKSSRLGFLPLIFLAWANLHGGFMVGLAVLILYCLGEGLMVCLHLPRPSGCSFRGEARPYPARRWRILLFLSLISAVFALINPNGTGVFLYSTRINKLSAFIYVWQSFSLASWREWSLSQSFFPAVILLTALSFIFNRRKINFSHLLLFSVFAYLGFRAFRNIFLFAIVAPTLLAHNLAAYPWLKPKNRCFYRLGPAFLGLVLAGTILYPQLEPDPFRKDIHQEFGWGISSLTYPMGTAEFISENRLQGRFFNSFGIGGYLIWRFWPGQKVYLDGRLSVYTVPFLLNYNQLLIRPSFFPQECEKWHFNLAIVDYPNPSNFLLLKWLEGSPDWNLTYFDANSALFLRAPGPESLALRQAGLKESLTPGTSSPRQAYAKGCFLLLIGRVEEALPFLLQARQAYPRSASIYTKLAQAYLVQKDWESAEAAGREALRCGGNQASLLLILSHIHFVNEKWEESIAAAEEGLRLDPTQSGGYEILGDACMKTGEDDRALAAYLAGAKEGADEDLVIKIADIYFTRENYEQAGRWYGKVTPASPHFPRARVYLAGCYAQEKDYPRAGAIYRTCARKFPELSQVCFFNLAKICLRQGKEAEAGRWLQKIDDPQIREKIMSDDSLRRLVK